MRRTETIAGLDRVVEIGAQQLSNSFLRSRRLLREAFELYNRPLQDLGAPIFEGKAAGTGARASESLDHQSELAPASRIFWEAIGFHYAALDFDGHRNSIPLDLNRDSVAADLKGFFHLAVNAGTTEHVANQDNAFRIIHDLVCKGGIMIHEVPGQGMMNHGLINYNPKFFWHLCRENGYEVLNMKIASTMTSPVPKNVLDNNRIYSGTSQQLISRKIGEAIPDFVISAVLRKLHDKEFVTPMDLAV